VLASRAGHVWAEAWARALHSQGRAITGAWPGTLTEARGRVLVALTDRERSAISLDELRALARATNHAARALWRTVAVPDQEV
jgi:hypothetical protein